MVGPEIFINILLFAPGFLLGIVFHEVAHAWTADKLGDPTARMLGRITLNPMRHIDMWGTVFLPFMILFMSRGSMVFGYAKPVPVTGDNFRRPKRDHLIVALAGPAANILLSMAILLLAWVMRYLGFLDNSGLRQVLYAGLNINIILAAFNLLPLPPLDGSEILTALLPGPWAYRFQRLAPYTFLILIGLFLTGLIKIFMIPISVFIQLLLAPFGNPFYPG
ncbi:site-2 protease family protein [bacterium]|nr:site-2 protease family protein [bacterium]